MSAKLTAEERKSIKNGLDASDDRPRPLFDVANAERFARQHRDRLRYCDALGGWLIWQGKYWAADPDDQVMGLAVKTAESLWNEVRSARGDHRRTAAMKAYSYAQRKNALRAMIDLAKHKLAMELAVFDRDPFALNVLNGTIDLRTGKRKPHDPNDFITKLIKLKYDPKAKAPRWRKFLTEVLPGNLLPYVHRAVGYSLTADQSAQCLFVLVGEGANGKGVLMNTIRAVIGRYGSTGRSELLIRKHFENANNEDLAGLQGQRFVEVSETGRTHELNEEQVKNLTGEDRMKASYKYRSLMEFPPTHHIWLRTNNKPIIHGADYAIWRRLKIIPFNLKFVKRSEYRASRGNDPTLRVLNDRLSKTLQGELEGILAWGVRGAMLWLNRGRPDLREPKAVTDAVEEYRNEMDRLGLFIGDCCERVAGEKVLTKSLYAKYKIWAVEKGWKPWADNTFGSYLTKARFKLARIGTERAREGLRLKPTAEQNTEAAFQKKLAGATKKKRYAR